MDHAAEGKEQSEDWPAILATAKERGLGQCSICLGNNKGLRGLSLLSCSHIMHNSCLSSLKRFAKDRKVRRFAARHSSHYMYYMSQPYNHSHFFSNILLNSFIYAFSLILPLHDQQSWGCPLCLGALQLSPCKLQLRASGPNAIIAIESALSH